MKENENNPLLCNPETGLCEMPGESKEQASVSVTHDGAKPVKIVYYTDPICSSCWGIEPQLRKLKLEYGAYFEMDYRMGGLLPDWSYNSGGISKPADVAHHWDEASLYYQMPIDGDVWLEDPLDSSYPSCIAVKAGQLQDANKAIAFMRILREGLFLDKKNMAKWENIAPAAEKAGLDVTQLKQDFDGKAKQLFQEDLLLGRKLGVRGFPTLYFSDGMGNQLAVNGSRPYEQFEKTLLMLCPDAKKTPFNNTTAMALFEVYPTLTIREYAEILDMTRSEAKVILEKLYNDGLITQKVIKTGVLYSKK